MNQLSRLTKDELRSHPGLNNATPAQLAEAWGVMAVALSQPHRQGNPDPRLESALGRLCMAQEWHPTCFDAGVQYGDNIRRLRLSEGFKVPSITPSTFGEPITPEMKELYRIRVQNADYELKSIKLRLPSVMVSLCCDNREQDASAFGIIKGGLVRLAFHYGMRKFFHEPA
jgi:hypothetical protein